MPPFLFGYDFYYLWAVGALLHHGQNPYDVGLLHQQLDAIGWPATENPQQFTHPVNAVWLYWIFALVPFKVALLLWSVASIIIIVGCSRAVVSLLDLRYRVSPELVVFTAVIFPPTLGNLIWAQVNAILLLGVTMFGVMWRLERYFTAGLWLSLILLKPHNFVPFLVVVFLFELRSGRKRVPLGCVAGFLLQMLASLAIAPDAVRWYRGSLEGILGNALPLKGATLGQQLESVCDWTLLRPSLVVLGSLAAIWIISRRGYSLRSLLGIVIPLSLCASPYCWMHSFVVLLPCVFLILGRARFRMSEAALRYGMVGIAVLSLPLIVDPATQVVWVIFVWAILLGGLLLVSSTAEREGDAVG